MQQKLRLKILQKLAQATPAQNTAQTTTVAGSPPPFVATQWYPTILLAFNAQNAGWINTLANLLNIAIFYSSGGKKHLTWMRTQNFNFDSSSTPNLDLKYLMEFSKLVYQNLFTNRGVAFTAAVTPEDLKNRLNVLNSSQPLASMSATNPQGQLATKISGNVRALIKSYLLNIK